MPIHPILGAVLPYMQGENVFQMIGRNIQEQQARQQKLRADEALMGLREMQTKKITREIEHPELSLAGLPAIARQRQYVESIGNRYGKESGKYKQAKSDLDLSLQNLRGQIGYREALKKSLPARALTVIGKAMLEQQRIKAGLSPTGDPLEMPARPIGSMPKAEAIATPTGVKMPAQTGVPLGARTTEEKLVDSTPEDINKAAEAPFGSADSSLYTLYLSKQAGLGDNLKKLSFGSVLEKSIDLMTPYKASMAYYSGVGGKSRYARDVLEAQRTGKLSPELRDYTKFSEIATSTLVPQITQYYGTSITEGQQKLIRAVSNPATWKNSPEMAMVAFDTLINTLEQEIMVRRDLVKKPSKLIKQHPKTMEFAEQLKGTGYTLQDVIEFADKNHKPFTDVLNRLFAAESKKTKSGGK